MREWLPAASYDRPVTVLMAFVALLVLGVISWTRMPVQMMPDGFELGFLWVQVPYSNASPAETDEEIVRPVEAQISTVPGIASLNSTASSGSGGFGLEFHNGVDLDQAYNAVVDRLERAMVDLPEEVERYWVYKYNPNDNPIIWAGVELPPDMEDPYYVMTRVVQPRLERIPGVASLDVWGVPQRSVYIDYDKERTYAAGVDLGTVVGGLQSGNFQMSSGRINDRGLIRHARSLARLNSVEDIRRFPVKTGVNLEDIADVQMRSAYSANLNRINGADAAALALKKEASANTVEVAKAVKEAFRELEADPRVQGAHFFVFFNQGDLIEDSVDTLATTAITGGLFALVILYLFLREWKMTLLIAASIPFSLMITIAALYFRGDTLNLLSLMGLMLAVGMVVDNAIVVVETIYRRRAEGAGVRAAAVGGTAEVNLAILMSTLTTMVVFLPVILMSENAMLGFFMSVLGLPVVLALGASLLVALVFAPLATKYMGKASIRKDPAWLLWLSKRYSRVLKWVLSHRVDAAMGLFFMAVFTFMVAIPGLDWTGSPDENLNDFAIRFEVPPQMGMGDRDAVLREIEEVVETHKEEWGVRVYRSRLSSNSNHGRINVYLEAGGMDREDVMDAAREVLPSGRPGVKATIGWDSGDEGGGGGAQTITLQINGEDMDTLTALAEEVARRAETVPGVMEVHQDVVNDGADELRLRIDRHATGRYGVSAAQVGRTVGFAMRGTALPSLQDGEKEIPVQSRFSLEDRSDLDTLLDFEIWSPEKQILVPMRTLTSTEMGKGPSSIRRNNRRTGVGITLDLEEDAAFLDVFAGVDAALADMAFPRGYDWSKGKRFDQQGQDDEAMWLALMLSVCFVFLLMGVLFESWILPLSVVTSIPMAMMGAVWFLYMTGTGMDMMATVGLIVLVGVVVNNGIVLVDLVTQLRADGMARREALLHAGERRLRPILMTALTTICGLIPMAVGSSAFIGIPYAPLGRTVIGGMIAGTLLTLLFVPYLYTLLDDLREAASHWLTFVMRRSA